MSARLAPDQTPCPHCDNGFILDEPRGPSGMGERCEYCEGSGVVDAEPEEAE